VSRFAVDGPAVVVPARIAYLFEKHFELERLRREWHGRDHELDVVLLSWHAVALQYVDTARATASGNGSSMASTAEAAAPSEVVAAVDSSEVARAAGITSRAVRLAAEEGRLPGKRVAGRWWFTPEDVAAWQAARAS
jgi:hypothetical protein